MKDKGNGTNGYCAFDHKMNYDKKTARTARNKRMKDGHVALRIYYCEHSNFWHLTSQEPNREQEMFARRKWNN